MAYLCYIIVLKMGKQFYFLLITIVVFLGLSLVYAQNKGTRAKRPLPQNYGDVVMNNFSENYGMSPVVFKHWIHRAKYTCKVCHIDFGFAMKAGNTPMKEGESKEEGRYCMACHNGKEAFATTTKKPSGEEEDNCDKCHSYKKDVKFAFDYFKFTKKFPKERFGDGIDWGKAVEGGFIKLQNEVPASPDKKDVEEGQDDFFFESKVSGIPDIIFSHKKHLVWGNCDMCHAEIFGYERGSTTYPMDEIFNGKFCGVCHGKVAFPNDDCQRCHIKKV